MGLPVRTAEKRPGWVTGGQCVSIYGSPMECMGLFQLQNQINHFKTGRLDFQRSLCPELSQPPVPDPPCRNASSAR